MATLVGLLRSPPKYFSPAWANFVRFRTLSFQNPQSTLTNGSAILRIVKILRRFVWVLAIRNTPQSPNTISPPTKILNISASKKSYKRMTSISKWVMPSTANFRYSWRWQGQVSLRWDLNMSIIAFSLTNFSKWFWQTILWNLKRISTNWRDIRRMRMK